MRMYIITITCDYMHLVYGPQGESVQEQTIIGAMINQAPSLGPSEAETDDYFQQIGINLLSGMLELICLK